MDTLATIKFGQYHVLEQMMKQPNFDFAKQKDLNFSGKNLTDTPPLRALRLLPSLLVIDFSHNLIDSFSTENLIRGAPLLEELNFSYNNITTLDNLIELGSLDHLKKLNFFETPVANRLVRIKILEFLLFPAKYKPHEPVKILTATYQHVPDNSKIDSKAFEQTKQFYRFLERDIQEIPPQRDGVTQNNKHNNKDSLVKLGLKPCPTPRLTRFPCLQILNNEVITVKDVCSILMVDNLDAILKGKEKPDEKSKKLTLPAKEGPKVNVMPVKKELATSEKIKKPTSAKEEPKTKNPPDEKSKKLHQEYLEKYKKRHARKEDEENNKGYELIHEKETNTGSEADELLILFKSDQAERDKKRVVKKNSGKLWERPLDLQYKDAEYNISIKDHNKMLKDHEERKKKIIADKKLKRQLYVEKVRALAKLDKKKKKKNKDFELPEGCIDDKNDEFFDPLETDPEMKKLFGFKPKRKPKLSLDLGRNYSHLDSQESELKEGDDEDRSHASFSRTAISLEKRRYSEDLVNISSLSVSNSPLFKNKKDREGRITVNTNVQLEDVKYSEDNSSPNKSYKDSPGRVSSPFKKGRVMIRGSETFRSRNEAESIEPFVLDVSKTQRLKKTFYVIKESTPNLSLPMHPPRDSKSPATSRNSIQPKEEYNFVKKDNEGLSARRSEWENIETIPKTEVQNIYRGTEEGIDLTSVDFLAVMQASARGPEFKNELLKTEEPITFKNLQSQQSAELNVDQLNALFKGETKGLTFSNVTLSNRETHRPTHGALEKHPQILQENYPEDDESQPERIQTVDQEGNQEPEEKDYHPTGTEALTPQPSPREDIQTTAFDEIAGTIKSPTPFEHEPATNQPARPLTANNRIVRVSNLESPGRVQTAAGHRRSNSKPEKFASILIVGAVSPDALKKAMTPVLGSSSSVKILNHKNLNALKTKLQDKKSFKISNKIFFRHQKSASQASLVSQNKSPAQSPVRKPNLTMKSARFEWTLWNTRKGSIEKNDEQADQSGVPSIKNRRSSITSEQVQQPLNTPQNHQQRKIRYPSMAFEATSSRATVKGGQEESSTMSPEKTSARARPLSHRKNYVKETPKIIVKKPLTVTQSLAPENRVNPESLIPGPQDGVSEKMKLNLIQSKRGTFAQIVETAKMLDETALLIQQAKEIHDQVETVKSQRGIRYPEQIVHHDTIAEFLRLHNQVEKLSFEDNMKLKELVNLVNDFDQNKQVKLTRLATEDKLREMKKKALTLEGKALEEMTREIINLSRYLEIIEDIEAQRDIGKNTKQIHRMEMKEIERAETNAVLAAHYTKLKKYYGESHVNRFFKGHKEVLANMEASAQSGARIDFAHKVRKQNNSQGRAYNLGVYNEAELYPHASKPKTNDSRDDIKKEEIEPDWLTFTRVAKYVPKPMFTFEELTEMTMRKRNDQRNKAGHRVLTVEEKMMRYVEDLKEDAKKKKELKARIDKHIREGEKDIDEFLLTSKIEINKLYDKTACFREYVKLIWENKI